METDAKVPPLPNKTQEAGQEAGQEAEQPTRTDAAKTSKKKRKKAEDGGSAIEDGPGMLHISQADYLQQLAEALTRVRSYVQTAISADPVEANRGCFLLKVGLDMIQNGIKTRVKALCAQADS